MVLSETGEARVHGYLFVLERSLKTFLPAEVVRDAVREIESHLRERIAAVKAFPDERTSLEQILAELGPPLRVAQAYSAERTLDEAVTTGRFVPVVRAIWHLAVTTVVGFLTALSLLSGYVIGFVFLVIAALKPVFPDHVGFWSRSGWNGLPTNLQIRFALQPNEHPVGGYWVILFCLFCGLGLLVATYRGSRSFLNWWRDRHSSRSLLFRRRPPSAQRLDPPTG
jgi:hypothetical protein